MSKNKKQIKQLQADLASTVSTLHYLSLFFLTATLSLLIPALLMVIAGASQDSSIILSIGGISVLASVIDITLAMIYISKALSNSVPKHRGTSGDSVVETPRVVGEPELAYSKPENEILVLLDGNCECSFFRSWSWRIRQNLRCKDLFPLPQADERALESQFLTSILIRETAL